MTYLEQCNKYFAPLDEIGEALRNKEGVAGISNFELVNKVVQDKELVSDLIAYEDLAVSINGSSCTIIDIYEE